jgi:hypothetical protein
MTKDQMKRLLPIITAFTEGKKIEWKNRGGQWEPFEDGIFADNAENFRIVPEPQLVPFTFKDAEFLIGKPVRDKDSVALIVNVKPDTVHISNGSGAHSFTSLLRYFIFMDGTPCGKLVETTKI